MITSVLKGLVVSMALLALSAEGYGQAVRGSDSEEGYRVLMRPAEASRIRGSGQWAARPVALPAAPSTEEVCWLEVDKVVLEDPSPGPVVVILCGEDERFHLRMEEISEHPETSGFTRFGDFVDSPGGAVFVKTQTGLFGLVSSGEKNYEMSPSVFPSSSEPRKLTGPPETSEDGWLLVRARLLRQEQFPPDHPQDLGPDLTEPEASSCWVPERQAVIRVLTAYTQKAKKILRQQGYDVLSHSRVLEGVTNWSLWRADLPVMVATVPVSSDEVRVKGSNSLKDDVRLLRKKQNCGAPCCARMRYEADVVALVHRYPGACGLTFQRGAEKDGAFFVVDVLCGVGKFIFPHELGHVLGADHDPRYWALNRTEIPFRFYGMGYCENDDEWHTLMATACDFGVNRLLLWSSPADCYMGKRTGSPWEDNARVIMERAPCVARFLP